MTSRSLGWTVLLATLWLVPGTSRADEPSDPFLAFHLPDDWEARFWATPNAKAALRPRAASGCRPRPGPGWDPVLPLSRL